MSWRTAFHCAGPVSAEPAVLVPAGGGHPPRCHPLRSTPDRSRFEIGRNPLAIAAQAGGTPHTQKSARNSEAADPSAAMPAVGRLETSSRRSGRESTQLRSARGFTAETRVRIDLTEGKLQKTGLSADGEVTTQPQPRDPLCIYLRPSWTCS